MPKGSFSRLTVGTTLSRGDLMHLALMSSENRAAHALGNNYPGGMPAMVAAMNAKAAELGMVNSHFVDPTGLSSQNVASPEDLSKLVIAASHNPSIREYSTDRRYAVKVRRHMVEFHNTDNLVANPTWNIIVQKTGYISEAGKCLVMAAVIEGRSVVIVLLDSMASTRASRMPSGSRLGWKRAPARVFRCRCASFPWPLPTGGIRKTCDWPNTSDRSWAMRVHLLAIGCVFCSGVSAPAMAADRTLSVTIYADDLALVQDRRDIEVKGGRQRIEFQDVSAQIRPETASLTAGDISIVEQNFDFDLLTPAKADGKAVGHEVTIVRVNPATGAETGAGPGSRHQWRRGVEDWAAHRGVAR